MTKAQLKILKEISEGKQPNQKGWSVVRRNLLAKGLIQYGATNQHGIVALEVTAAGKTLVQ